MWSLIGGIKMKESKLGEILIDLINQYFRKDNLDNLADFETDLVTNPAMFEDAKAHASVAKVGPYFNLLKTKALSVEKSESKLIK